MQPEYSDDHPYASSVNVLSNLLSDAIQANGIGDLSYEIDYAFGNELKQVVLLKLKQYNLGEPEIQEDALSPTSIVVLEAEGLDGLSRIIRFDKDMTEIVMLDVAAQLRIAEYDFQINHPFKNWVARLFGFRRVSTIPTTMEITAEVNEVYSPVRSALFDN